MAGIPSPFELASLIKFCVVLGSKCISAPGELSDATDDVLACKINLEASESLLQNARYAAHLRRSKKDAANFRFFIDKLQEVLRRINAIIDDYRPMNALDRLRWAMYKKSEMDDHVARLQDWTTRLDSFLSHLDRTLVTASKIERHFERTGSAEKAAERSCADRAGSTLKDREKYAQYAKELERARDRAETRKPGPVQAPPSTKRPGEFLECYTVKKLSGLGNGGMAMKELKRGQLKLEQMAKSFRSSSFNGKFVKTEVEGKDDRVRWVLSERRKGEKSAKYEWVFLAARVVERQELMMGLVKEERVMVIIKRRMTKEGAREWDQKQKAAAEKKKAAQEKKKADPAKQKADGDKSKPKPKPNKPKTNGDGKGKKNKPKAFENGQQQNGNGVLKPSPQTKVVSPKHVHFQ